MKRVVATIGLIGAGKDTLGRLLADYSGGDFLSISDFVYIEAAQASISLDRKSLTNFSSEKIKLFGPSYFVGKAIKAARETESLAVIISGARTLNDIAALRSEFGEDFRLLAISIKDHLVRYQRIRERSLEKDPRDFSDLAVNDREQERAFGLSKAMAAADLVVDNSEDLEALRAWCKEYVGPHFDRLFASTKASCGT